MSSACSILFDPKTNHHNTEMEYLVLSPNLGPRSMIHPSAHRTTISLFPCGQVKEENMVKILLTGEYLVFESICNYVTNITRRTLENSGERISSHGEMWSVCLIHHAVEKEIASDESKHKMTQQWLVSQDPRRKPTGMWRQKVWNETSSWT